MSLQKFYGALILCQAVRWHSLCLKRTPSLVRQDYYKDDIANAVLDICLGLCGGAGEEQQNQDNPQNMVCMRRDSKKKQNYLLKGGPLVLQTSPLGECSGNPSVSVYQLALL